MSQKSRVDPIADGSRIWKSASWPRALSAAILLPLVALGVRIWLAGNAPSWSLFYGAVFLASWLGGFRGGIGATVLSTLLVWWFFVPPAFSFAGHHIDQLLAVAIFITIGTTVSVMHGRLRRFNEEAVRNLDALRRANDALDSTNRRLARITRELAESQQFLEAILDYSPSGIVIKDLKGRYLLINRRLQEQLGVPVGEARGKTDFDLFPTAIAERHRANDETVIRTAAPLTFEKTTELNGTSRVLLASLFPLYDEEGRIFAICEISSDITDRKRTEEALRQSDADLREAQRVAHVGSWSWDMRTDRTRWSEELYRIFERDPSQPLPKLSDEGAHILTPESVTTLRAAVERAIEDGIPYELELEFTRPDGALRWMATRGEPVRDEDGTITGITGTVQDITELKDLQRLREEWISVIAHDLRQPIGVITMATDLLAELHASDADSRKRVPMERIRSSARGLARMVNDLLDLSLLEANRLKLECRRVDPTTIVRETVERLSQLTKTSPVRVHGAADVPDIDADPMRIGQVLGNLISNAVKYGEPGKPIDVTVGRRGPDVEISVTNEGRGITREELPRLFARFSRSKDARGGPPGLGVGLYISKGLVEAHGGRMWVESTPGKTTTFSFTLPSRPAARAAA